MTFAELITAAEHGAASVYHAILKCAVEIEAWESSPVVAPLVEAGVGMANGLLARVGVNGAVITSDVLGALKLIAAKDATVPSMGSIGALGDLVGTVVKAVVPAAAAAVTAAQLVEGVVESVVTGIAVPQPAPDSAAEATAG